MKFKTLKGGFKTKNIYPYRVDWDAECRSKFQFETKQFFRPFWDKYLVYEEMPCPGSGSKITLDLYCDTLSIAVESDGGMHDSYSKFFHGNRSGYLKSIKNDLLKEEWCAVNNINLIRIKYAERKQLSVEWLKETFGIHLT